MAGSLDRSVDPAPVFRIEPAVAGALDWRDPVTLRFRPAAPLPAGASYTVTLSDEFDAMDGSRLERPFTFGATLAVDPSHRLVRPRGGSPWRCGSATSAGGRWTG